MIPDPRLREISFGEAEGRPNDWLAPGGEPRLATAAPVGVVQRALRDQIEGIADDMGYADGRTEVVAIRTAAMACPVARSLGTRRAGEAPHVLYLRAGSAMRDTVDPGGDDRRDVATRPVSASDERRTRRIRTPPRSVRIRPERAAHRCQGESAEREEIGMADGTQVAAAAWQAIATRDPGRIGSVFTADAEWLAPAGNATATTIGGEHHLVGRDRIVRFLATEFRQVFTDVEVEVRGIVAAGSTVVVEHRMRATVAGGLPYDVDYCFVIELADGLIHRVREYLDTRRGAAMFAGNPV